MSAFRKLKEISNNFEIQLKNASNELFSAKTGETFEDGISKRMRDLSLFNSKLKLLKAKSVAATPQVTEEDKNDATILKNYEDLATTKVLEQQAVKFLMQSHAVKALLTTADKNLDPELVDRKHKIAQALTTYGHKESQLRHLDSLLREKQAQLAAAQDQWHGLLGELRDMRDGIDDTEEMDATGPFDRKLQTLVDKLEVMRWLLGKLVTARTGGYDWLSDPHRRLTALTLARTPHTVQMFTDS